MTDVFFYCLNNDKLGAILATLLEKTLERGWRAIVEFSDRELMQNLNKQLWSYRDDSFLPHDIANGEDDQNQQVLLTKAQDNPNQAQVRFFVNKAKPHNIDSYNRVIIVIDKNDSDELAKGQSLGDRCRDSGHTVKYWRQNDDTPGWQSLEKLTKG